MRIGFIGGTAFVGRHMVEHALDLGHDVTVFHRGRTGTSLFPGVEHVLGDRSRDLHTLRGRGFDALIDVCAYRPREVSAVADTIGDEVGQYLYVSSVSAYRTDGDSNLTEDSPLLGAQDLADPATEIIDDDTYGPLEALCEAVAAERFVGRSTVLRPCYVIGPHDRSDRFTSWVRRCAEGGEVLAAGPPDAPIQVIDARDLATFALALVETGSTGAYNGVGPAAPTTWRAMLDECRAHAGPGRDGTGTSPPRTTVTWCEARRVRDLGVDPEVAFPMWEPPERAASMRCSTAKSLGAGLTLRSLAESIHDLDAWDEARGRPPLVAGLDRSDHDRLLAALTGR